MDITLVPRTYDDDNESAAFETFILKIAGDLQFSNVYGIYCDVIYRNINTEFNLLQK